MAGLVFRTTHPKQSNLIGTRNGVAARNSCSDLGCGATEGRVSARVVWVDHGDAVLAGYVAWFEQLARSGAQSRRFAGGVAVIGGTSSNTDNGLAIDPSHVPGGELRDAIAWLRSANLPCSCVLTATARVRCCKASRSFKSCRTIRQA